MSTRVGDQRDWSNADRHKSTNQDQVLRRMPFLEDYLKPKIDLLEIGCSSGFMLDAFREKNINCYGVEPSGEFNEYLNKQGYEVYILYIIQRDDCHGFEIAKDIDPKYCELLFKAVKKNLGQKD